MKTIVKLAVLSILATASIPYFKYSREIHGSGSGHQSYFVVDETLWQHARPDLSDLRLYAEAEIPYAFTVEQGGSETERKQIRVLQPSAVAGKTQFLLDMSGVPEYDRIELGLAARNFVAHARTEGQDDAHGAQWALLGVTTLYDLSDEKLGHNSTLQVPLATYKYLRVNLDGPVKPSDIQSATAGITRAQKAVWRDVSSSSKRGEQGKDTVWTFSFPGNVSLERLVFEIDPSQQNFRRDLEIQDGNGQWLGSGEISRIHMERNGKKIDVEQTSLNIRGTSLGTLRAIIHNGDDLPLKLGGAHLQQYERRIYFESALQLLHVYYGDEKLAAPIYDFAKLFQKDPNAIAVKLDPEVANRDFVGRPDERPWSERHPAVLWAAILVAVLILGTIALRSMRGGTT